jgi:hypothetical protein
LGRHLAASVLPFALIHRITEKVGILRTSPVRSSPKFGYEGPLGENLPLGED